MHVVMDKHLYSFLIQYLKSQLFNYHKCICAKWIKEFILLLFYSEKVTIESRENKIGRAHV